MTAKTSSSRRFYTPILLGVTLAMMAGAPLSASWGAAANGATSTPLTVRPDLGKPLMAAQKLLHEGKYREALAELQQAQSTPNLTQSEELLIDRFRGAAAAGAGDYALAANSFEAVVAAGHLQAQDELTLTQTIGELLYRAKDYRNAAVWLKRYVAEGGSDPQTSGLLGQAYYLDGDYGVATQVLLDDIHRIELKGDKPSIQQLEFLATCQSKLKDETGYTATLEELATLDPKPQYWTELIQRVVSRPNFPMRLEIESGLLNSATGTLDEADEIVELAEEALQNGLPGVAVTVLNKGFASGVLGHGPGTERQKRLAAMAKRNAAADLKELPEEESVAATRPDGTALVNVGWGYLGEGMAAKAVSLMEKGVAKGHLKHPRGALLDLGIAQLTAGHGDMAIQSFQAVKGSDGTAGLARLWIAFARSSLNGGTR